jgi:hypothetical protein
MCMSPSRHEKVIPHSINCCMIDTCTTYCLLNCFMHVSASSVSEISVKQKWKT